MICCSIGIVVGDVACIGRCHCRHGHFVTRRRENVERRPTNEIIAERVKIVEKSLFRVDFLLIIMVNVMILFRMVMLRRMRLRRWLLLLSVTTHVKLSNK